MGLIKVAEDFKIENLKVAFSLKNDEIKAIDGVDIIFPHDKVTAIIGESGCGKSVLAQTIFHLLPDYAVTSGSVFYGNIDILNADNCHLQKFWGKEWGLIPQLPGESFSPVRKIKKHFNDIIKFSGQTELTMSNVREILTLFDLHDHERILNAYPHELSGGMLQRVLCAMAVLTSPKWILADEPTKGLDEDSYSSVFDNLNKIKKSIVKSMVVITHDLNLAINFSDIIAVMYAGQIIEINTNLLNKPLHPYTKALIQALPANGFKITNRTATIKLEQNNGCKFAPRCPNCMPKCLLENSPLISQKNANSVRCFMYA